jgi:hypothetical protein
MRDGQGGEMKIEFMPVGRSRREWMWKVRDESNTITISGYRFGSLRDAVRDARLQIDSDNGPQDPDGPFSA